MEIQKHKLGLKIFCIVVGLLFFGVSSVWSVSSNLLSNPGFEEYTDSDVKELNSGATVKNWQINPSVPGKVQLVIGQEKSHSGKQCLILIPENVNRGVHLYQAVPIDSRKQYVFEFWAKGEGGEVTLTIYQYDSSAWMGSVASEHFSTVDAWKEFEYQYTPSIEKVSNVGCAIGVVNVPVVYIDDASFLEVKKDKIIGEIVPIQSMTDRVVFWDTRIDTASASFYERRLVDWFVKNSFKELNSEALRSWMEENITQKKAYGSVVVMPMDAAPATIADSSGEKALWYQYLLSGGRIVWIGDIPFWGISQVDATPNPYNVGFYDSLKVLGLNNSYWDRDYPAQITEEGKKWGFETTDPSFRGFSKNSVTTAFSIFDVPKEEIKGTSNFMINICPEMPYSGLIKLCQRFDGRNDVVLRDVWRAANYVGTPVVVPPMPEPYQSPSPPLLSMNLSASGMGGRREFNRGEKVQVEVSTEKIPQATTVQVSLLKREKTVESFNQITKDTKASLVLDTSRYAYGSYMLRVDATDSIGKSLSKLEENVGIRYVPPAYFHVGFWTGGGSPYRRDMKFADIHNAGFEVYLSTLNNVQEYAETLDAILKQNMGCSLRMDDYRGSEREYEKSSEVCRTRPDGKPYMALLANSAVGITHPTVVEKVKEALIRNYEPIANHPAVRPYILTNDDYGVIYGADFAEHVVKKFKEKTGLDAPRQIAPNVIGGELRQSDKPQPGIIPDSNVWLQWCLFSLEHTTGAFGKAQKEAVVSVRTDTRIGPIPGDMHSPFILMWNASEYPPLNFGEKGFNLISCYYYNTYRQPQIAHTFWLEVGRMGNRELPVWIMPDVGYERWQKSAGYQRNNLFHLLAGGVKGLAYFTYDDRGLDQWNEMKRLAPVIHRVAPVQAKLEIPPRDIGLLHSITTNCFDPRFQQTLSHVYNNLVQGHFGVDVIAEEEILNGIDSKYKAIILHNVKWLRQSVSEELKKYASNGGLVMLDSTVPFDITGAKRLSIDLGTGEQKANPAFSGISDYGEPERIKRVAGEVGRYVPPLFKCDDTSVVGHPFRIGSVAYLWFVNTLTEKEYRFYYERMSTGSPGACSPENLAQVKAWEKNEPSTYSAQIGFKNLHGVPYDLNTGKKLPLEEENGLQVIRVTMERFGGTLVAFYPEEIRKVIVSAPNVVSPLTETEIKIKVLGEKGLVPGVVPVKINITSPTGEILVTSGIFSAVNGEYDFHFTPAINDPPGKWNISIEEMASNKTGEVSISVEE